MENFNLSLIPVSLLGAFFTYLFTHGKLRRWLISVSVIVLLVAIVITLSDVLGYRWVFPLEKKGEQILGERKEGGREASDPKTLEKRPTSSCSEGSYCSDFLKDDWEGWEYFYKRQIDKVVLIPQISKVQDNPVLWFTSKLTAPNFDVLLKIAPQKEEKGNAVIKYGDWWRCIIAESNYNTVACEGKDRKSEREFKTFSSLSKKPIQPKTGMSIRLSSTITTNNKVSITLVVDYIDTSSNADSATFTFSLPSYSSDPLGTEKPVGVGIIDSKEEGIGVEFMHFELRPKF